MGIQLMDNAAALSMFFTDDVYLVDGDSNIDPAPAPQQFVTTSTGSILPAPKAAPDIPAAAMPEVLNTPVMASPVLPLSESISPGSPSAESAFAEIKSPEFKYIGKNQKCVLILVNDVENAVSSEKGRELLRNIVKAIQLSASDFALVNYSEYKSAEFSDFAEFFSCRLLLAFGITPTQLGLSEYPQNKLVLEGSVQMVFSANLDTLAADQNGKKTLWGSLKQLSI